MGDHDARRRAAWRFVRAVIRSQLDGVIGAALSGLLWQAGAVAAPLIVKYAIDHGVLTHDRHALLLWLGGLLGVGLLEMAAGAGRHAPSSGWPGGRRRSGPCVCRGSAAALGRTPAATTPARNGCRRAGGRPRRSSRRPSRVSAS